MKRLKLFALGLLTTSMFLTSCSDEEDDDANGPLLTVTEGLYGIDNGTVNATVGDNLTFTWDARKGDRDLHEFDVMVDGTSIADTTLAGNQLPFSLDNANDETYADGYVFSVGMNEGTRTIEFSVTDKDDLSDMVSVTVNVASDETPLATEVTGAFFHIGGSLEGAYDLVNDVVMAASANDADKDMVNTDAAGDAFTGSWEAGMGNATTFVKVSGFDYENATVESAMSAFANGAASSSVDNPAANDMYVALLRGTDYAVIKVTEVDPDNNDCNCGNTGKISFDYKK